MRTETPAYEAFTTEAEREFRDPLPAALLPRLDEHIRAAIQLNGRPILNTNAYYSEMLGFARVRDLLIYCRRQGCDAEIVCGGITADILLRLRMRVRR